MPSLLFLLVRVFLPSKHCTHTRLQIFYDSLQHGAWTSLHSRLFFAGHQGGFVRLGVALQILHDTTYLQVFLLRYVHGLLVFLEDAVSILNLSVLVLAGNFRLKCHQAIPHFIIYSNMICSSSWSLRDSSLSQVLCNDTSCRWSVHSDSSGNRQIIFINVFEGLNNSLSLFK